MRRILVVAAHPDDEVLGCGGLLIRSSRVGDRIRVLFMGDGVSARTSETGAAPFPALEAREQEARDAAKILGIEELFFFRFPDNRFDTVPLLDLARKVEEHFTEFRPQWVLTHHWSDLNIDHRKTHEAVLTAGRPLPGSDVEKLLGFEVHSSTEWGSGGALPFQPNLFFDITAVLPLKLAALSAYASELRPYPHPRSHETVTSAARRWGATAGCEAAEAYVLFREVIR